MELPSARRPEAAGAGGTRVLGEREVRRRAPLGRMWAPPRARPAPPTPRGRPGTVTVARGEGTFRMSSQLGRTRGSFPTVSTSAEAAGLAEAGAEDAVPPAAGAGRASLTASVSHRWAGGGAGLPHPVAPAGDSAPPIPSKNSLPPGRLPGLPPTPVPFGP